MVENYEFECLDSELKKVEKLANSGNPEDFSSAKIKLKILGKRGVDEERIYKTKGFVYAHLVDKCSLNSWDVYHLLLKDIVEEDERFTSKIRNAVAKIEKDWMEQKKFDISDLYSKPFE